MAKDDYSKVAECHCMHPAIRYYTKGFINMLNMKVVRVFYKCTNCKSRMYIDHLPESDYNILNVFDLLDKHK